MKGWFKSKGHKIAVAVGLFFATLHILWAVVVAFGAGQAFLNWVFPLHFIDNLYTVFQFDFVTALLLALGAFLGGYVVTWLFLWFWKLMKIK